MSVYPSGFVLTKLAGITRSRKRRGEEEGEEFHRGGSIVLVLPQENGVERLRRMVIANPEGVEDASRLGPEQAQIEVFKRRLVVFSRGLKLPFGG